MAKLSNKVIQMLAETIGERNKAGDTLAMDFLSRMQRAKDQGFDTSTVYYHGTNKDLSEFGAAGQQGEFEEYGDYIGKGIFGSKSPEVAERYALRSAKQGGGDPSIYPMYARMENPLTINRMKDFDDALKDFEPSKEFKDLYGEHLDPEQLRRYAFDDLSPQDQENYMRSQGFDSLIDNTYDQMAVMDPNQFRSVNAAFDPDKRESAGLLSGVGAGVGAAGLLAGAEETEAGPISKILNMSTAARKARAVEQGFDPETSFRGMPEPYDEEKLSHLTWTTKDPEYASAYAYGGADKTDTGRGGNVMPLNIKSERPFDFGFRSQFTDVKYGDMLDRLERGITQAYKDGKIGREEGLDLRDELIDLQDADTGEFKPVFEWWNDKPEMVDILKRAGYDSLTAKEGIGDNIGTTALFSPQQVRSVNAAFDPDKRESAGLLSGVGAGIGAAGLLGASQESDAAFIGKLAKTFSEPALDMADAMAKAGRSRDEIWEATGKEFGMPTYQDVDGAWKQEIDDSAMRMKYKERDKQVKALEDNLMLTAKSKGFNSPEFKEARSITQQMVTDINAPYRGEKIVRASQIYSNPELFEAYPELKNTRMQANYLGEKGGSLNTRTGDIKVSGGRKDLGSTVSHEFQHAIQEREGFAGGGSPEQFETAKARYNAESDAMGLREIIDETPDITDDELVAAYTEFWDEDAPRDLINYARQTDYKTLQGRLDEQYDVLGGVPDAADSFELYRRLAGEAESRNVQTRLPMSMGERVATPPWKTLDVPEGELKVMARPGGVKKSVGMAKRQRSRRSSRKRTRQAAGEDAFNQYMKKITSQKSNPYLDTIQGADVEAAGTLGNLLRAGKAAIKGSPAEILYPQGTEDYLNKLQYGDDIGVIDRILANPLL